MLCDLARGEAVSRSINRSINNQISSFLFLALSNVLVSVAYFGSKNFGFYSNTFYGQSHCILLYKLCMLSVRSYTALCITCSAIYHTSYVHTTEYHATICTFYTSALYPLSYHNTMRQPTPYDHHDDFGDY